MLVTMRGRGMSAGEIAKAMGVSRNAIIGKMDRMGMLRHKPRAARRPLPPEFMPKAQPSPPRRFSWQT
jgi:hypothetical protein